MNGAANIPERAIVLTFDDGFESLFQHGYPILSNYGFTATIFLVAGFCGKRNNWPSQPAGIPGISLLGWDQIREMDRNGIEFGAHTVNHPALDTLAAEDAKREIFESKDIIENKLGHHIEVFAYPYGRFNPMVKVFVSHAYKGACSTQVGYASQSSDLFVIPRIDVNYYKSPVLFRQLFRYISQPYLMARRLAHDAIGLFSNREWY